MAKSLAEFSQSRKRVNPLLEAPEKLQNEVIAGRQNGYGYRMIRRWLAEEHGIIVTDSQILSFTERRLSR